MSAHSVKPFLLRPFHEETEDGEVLGIAAVEGGLRLKADQGKIEDLVQIGEGGLIEDRGKFHA